MSTLPSMLKVLADPTRLRILALLSQEELSVGELARATALAQSRVSNHLKVLRESGMLEERREGSSVLVQLATGRGLPEELWAAIEPRVRELEERSDDLDRLQRVLEDRRQRSREFFDRVAPEWDVMGSDFARGAARLEALNRLIPRQLVVADVGCGTGYMARALVKQVDRVICVDHSEAMLAQARQTLQGLASKVEFRQGELDRLPLQDGEVDAVFAHMVMHHVPDLSAALREMHRALRPGGIMVITDLVPHREAWMTEQMADLRLGVDAPDLARRAERTGFRGARTETPDDAYVVESPGGQRIELPLFLFCAHKPTRSSANGDASLPSMVNEESRP